MRVLETPVHHVSDLLHWVEGTGYAAPGRTVAVTGALQLRLERAPADLRLVHRPGRTLLWRSREPALHPLHPGLATQAQRAHPGEAGFAVAGRVSAVDGRYNPRRFRVSAGNAAAPHIALYRSPLGTRLQSAGGVRIALQFDDGAPASWAVVSINVTPHVGAAMRFHAQADIAGDVQVPLDRLPALKKDAPRPDYDATLTVTALRAASDAPLADPDEFTPFDIGEPQTAGAFVPQIAFTLTPGQVQSLTSKDAQHLVLRAPS